MRYTKPALTLAEQADQLLRRGMKGDRALMMDCLAVASYYRRDGYWHPFRQPNSHESRASNSAFVLLQPGLLS